MANTVLRIRVDEQDGEYAAIKDYGDDTGYLEEIGIGATAGDAIRDLLRQISGVPAGWDDKIVRR